MFQYEKFLAVYILYTLILTEFDLQIITDEQKKTTANLIFLFPSVFFTKHHCADYHSLFRLLIFFPDFNLAD